MQEVGYGEEFARRLGEYQDDVDGDLEEAAWCFSGAVGAREASESDITSEEAYEAHLKMGVEAVWQERSLIGFLAGNLPGGHGFLNPHRKPDNVCVHEIKGFLDAGFDHASNPRL